MRWEWGEHFRRRRPGVEVNITHCCNYSEYEGMVSVFFPEKKKNLPRKFSIFCPRSLKSSREKILKTAREDTFLPEKKTAKFNPRKNNPCPRKKIHKYPLIITKIPPNSKISAREKQIFNPRKNLKICPRKLQNARENFKKSGREKHFLPEKKTKKVRKKCFLGHFSFSRGKKNTAPTPWEPSSFGSKSLVAL